MKRQIEYTEYFQSGSNSETPKRGQIFSMASPHESAVNKIERNSEVSKTITPAVLEQKMHFNYHSKQQRQSFIINPLHHFDHAWPLQTNDTIISQPCQSPN